MCYRLRVGAESAYGWRYLQIHGFHRNTETVSFAKLYLNHLLDAAKDGATAK
jgi:hypothetical protein